METEKLVNIIEDEFGLPFTKYELSVTGKKLVEKVEAETDYHFDKVVKVQSDSFQMNLRTTQVVG